MQALDLVQQLRKNSHRGLGPGTRTLQPARPLLTRRRRWRNRLRLRRTSSGRSVYNDYQHYWPQVGRYVQHDPIGLEGGLNPFLYAEGNALRYVDPYGLAKSSIDSAIEEAVLRGDVSKLRMLLDDAANISRSEADALIRQCTSRAFNVGEKVARQMAPRGWTREAIEEAVKSGRQVRAINQATGNPATRYVQPTSGQSVVLGDVTGEVIHVGGPGFRYGVASGDLP